MGWDYLIVLAIAAILAYALQPKPTVPKPASLEDFDIPVAEEGRPIPVVFGTVTVRGSNVLWYGALRTTAIKSKGK